MMLIVILKLTEDDANNMRVLEDSTAVRVIENWGRKQKAMEIAKNLLLDGDAPGKVSRVTGLDAEKVAELQAELAA